nr:hypothetical protein [Bradyrhizobium diazoefficiens]
MSSSFKWAFIRSASDLGSMPFKPAFGFFVSSITAGAPVLGGS